MANKYTLSVNNNHWILKVQIPCSLILLKLPPKSTLIGNESQSPARSKVSFSGMFKAFGNWTLATG